MKKNLALPRQVGDKVKKMKKQDFQIRIAVDATPHEVFQNINCVSKWWTEDLEGSSFELNDEFTVRFGDVHFSRQKLVEVIPDKKVVWLVTDSRLNFINDKDEWTNTKIIFELSTLDNKTLIHFTHVGLVPGVECYEACSTAWPRYIGESLMNLITSGKGQPSTKEKV